MSSDLAKLVRAVAGILSLLLLAAAVAAIWFYFVMRASLPALDGTARLPGLTAGATVTRDALGVPTVRAANRLDAARVLGFLHAQDRYFQLDLLRRRPAGELSALFGAAALPMDRATRPHRFRALAQRVFENLPPAHRALLESYTVGVNAGRATLAHKPFEYVVLGAEPAPWLPEDSILVIYAMTLDLQDATNAYERSLMTLRDTWGDAALAFFAPLVTPDDAALDGSTAPLPPVPGPRIIDLRRETGQRAALPPAAFARATVHEDLRPGSNSFALSGAHSATGSALLANDPHLNLALPNIWYRAVIEWTDPSGPRRLAGATLPGLPILVLGSNGSVAWSLTTAYADTSDLVAIDIDPVARQFYKLPGDEQLHQIEVRQDTIAVKGGATELVESSWTAWGPVVGTDSRQRPLAHRWVAHDPDATNLNFVELENASSVSDAMRIAHEAGVPAINLLAADRDGAIGWTIAGRLPKRAGFDGRLPVSWTFGDRRWDGFLSAAEIPTVVGPSNGRLWNGNQRPVGGAALARIGDGGFAAPPRAAQLRDRLATMENARPADFLALQRDDRALFLDRWQKLALRVLTPAATAEHDDRAEFRRLIEQWNARASVDSVGYRLVRTFRSTTAALALGPIFARCEERMPEFDWRRFSYEPALWALLEQKPLHLLTPEFPDWDALLLAAIDRTIESITEGGPSLDRAAWGEHNRARIRHPLSHALPGFVGALLNLPPDPLAGDAHMPLIQSPAFGASLRLVVSPGHEHDGLLHMPGGQSGHPLSPFYRAGHDAWVRGEPAPLLPGETRHTLTLAP